MTKPQMPERYDADGVLYSGVGRPVKDYDWVGIESEYRIGIIPIAEIGERYGISKSYIIKKAKELGWQRDIMARANRRAEAQANSEEERIRHLSPIAVDALTGKMTDFITSLKFTQRADIRKARAIVMDLFEELDSLTAMVVRDSLEDIDKAIAECEPMAVKKKYHAMMSLPTRVEMSTKLSVALRNLVELERKVYEMDIENQVKDDSLSSLVINISNNLGATLKPKVENAITEVSAGVGPNSINIFNMAKPDEIGEVIDHEEDY